MRLAIVLKLGDSQLCVWGGGGGGGGGWMGGDQLLSLEFSEIKNYLFSNLPPRNFAFPVMLYFATSILVRSRIVQF